MTITRILISTLVGVTSLVMISFGLIDYYRDYNNRIEGLLSKLDSITIQLSAALVNPMWTFNVTDITNILESFIQDKEVHIVFIEDEKRFIGRKQDTNRNIVPMQSRIFSKGEYCSENDIMFRGEKIGVLGVCLTDIYVNKELKTSLLYLLSSFVLLNFFLVSILFSVLMRKVFKPLKLIENYAVRMSTSSGIEDTQIKGKGFARELENLKNSIENMMHQLKSRYLELKKSQTALKETKKKYHEIFNNAAEGIFQTTEEGRLITANPAFAAILGYESPEEILASVTNVAKDFYAEPAERDQIRNIISTKGQVQNYETEFFRKDKSVISVSITAHSVFDDYKNHLYYEGMIVDITQKKMAEELKIAKEAAEATTLAKSVFLASMSHEIRTPISAIMGLTDLATKTKLTVKQRDYLEKIGSSANDLLGIINDILDFSKIEAGELNIDRVVFPLADVWKNLSDLFAKKCANKGVGLHFFIDDDVPKILIGDPLRVRQILINLTGNALKFTEKGEINIRVGVEKKSRDRVMLKFSVKDTGIGIRQDKLTTIFSPFTQLEPFIARNYSGTGLGLSICKQLVQMMGGEIWVKSKPGQGACFFFTADFGLQSKEQEQEYVSLGKNYNKAIDQESLKGVRILLVEDNSINMQVAVEMLEGKGIIVVCAKNGLEAVNTFSSLADETSSQFDAVLMDVQMPVMNGFEATKQIRHWESEQLDNEELKEIPRIPIIAMTAHAMKGDREKCIESGMDDYLTKPIDSDLLFETLLKLIFTGRCIPHATGEVHEIVGKVTTEDTEDDIETDLSDFFGADALPQINLSKGIRRLQGNKNLYVKLLHEFVQNHSNDIQKIKQALENEDIQLAQRYAHTFKGVVQSIAADHLSEIAEEIEDVLTQGETLKGSLLDNAQRSISMAADSISRMKNPQKEGNEALYLEKTSLGIDEITPSIREMYQLLKNNRIDADKYLDNLKAFLIHSGFETFAKELDISLGQFDFNGTRTVIEKIAKQFNISLERKAI